MIRSPRRLRWIAILLDAMIGVVIIAAALALWQWYREGGGLEAIYVFIGVVFAVLVTGRRWLQEQRSRTKRSPVAPPASAMLPTTLEGQRNRENLLNNIQHNWIDGFLKQSLHSEIELIVGHRPDAVGHLVLKQAGQPDQTITRERLPEIFTAAGRNLLILGEPGSGKTITLLQLAEFLLAEARQDPTEPMPVILNLSTWAQRQQPLAEWLVEELLLQYGLPRDFARAAIAHNHFRYLLDGLDEVAAEARDACAAVINEFKAIHPAEMVVCCRVSEYEALQQPLHLGSAIQIRPLNEAQIQDYLSKPELELQAVQATLAHDPDLRELVQSPLHLSMMTLAYKGLSREQLRPLRSATARRRHLFDSYVAKMFERRPLPPETSYTKPQALHWLANLAWGMAQHEQTNFYIERLQPTWLPPSHLRYYRLLARLLNDLLLGLSVGLGGGLFFGLFFGLSGVGVLSAGLSGLLIAVLIAVLLPVLIGRPIDWRIELVEELTWHIPPWQVLWSRHNVLLISGLFLVLILGLSEGLSEGLMSGLLAVLIGVPFVGLLFGLLGGLSFVLFGASVHEHEVSQRLQPNQGVRYSGRNGLRMALLFGLISGLLGGLIFGLLGERGIGLFAGLFGGLLFGLFLYGGGTWIQHYILRWLLARAGVLPPFSWRDRPFVQFLDAMHDRILLRRVGGGWVFIHRTLQEYFAEQAGDEGVRG